MDRKYFIKQAAILTTGSLLSKSSFGKMAALTGNKLSIGIVGFGDRGRGVASVAASLPDKFEITAICDVLDFRLDNARQDFPKAKQYKSYEALFQDKKVDAVIIATPLDMHFAVAQEAIKMGKQIYLEKTMTYNIEQAIALRSLKKQYPDLILQVGHQYRYSPLYFKVKEMIEKGYLGKVTQIDCRWDRNWNWRRPVPAGYTDEQINWRMYKAHSGGLVAELLSHQIDFINWAFDTHPDTVTGTGGIDYYKDGRQTFDNVQVTMRYKNAGMIGNFGSTCGNASDGYLFKIKGTKGSVHLLINEGLFYPEPQQKKELQTVDGVTGATKITWNKDGSIPILPEPTKDGTWYALNDFYISVKNKTQPSSNVDTGTRTAICVHLANKALYNQTIESWDASYNNL